MKDLKKEELPDSFKNMDQSKTSTQNIADVMYVGLEDEAL